MQKILGAIIVSVMLGFAQVASAGPFEDAVTAHERGEYATALKLLLPLAEQGNAKAHFYLGMMYAGGKGVAQDYKEAVRWFRKVAERGYAEAQHILGMMYYEGQGVAQDHKEAVKW